MENVDEWEEIFFLSLYGNYTQIQIYEFIHARFSKHLQKYFSRNGKLILRIRCIFWKNFCQDIEGKLKKKNNK